MKMINVIKKGTVLALATLGLCLSVSASAEPQWVKVSDFYDSNNNHGSIDTLCTIHAANLSHPQWDSFSYSGEWYWSLTNKRITCQLNSNPFWKGHSIDLKCPNGGSVSQDRPDGCYEFKEVTEPEPRCPSAGTITGSINGKDFGIDSSGRFCANGCVIDVPTKPKC